MRPAGIVEIIGCLVDSLYFVEYKLPCVFVYVAQDAVLILPAGLHLPVFIKEPPGPVHGHPACGSGTVAVQVICVSVDRDQ